MFIRQTGPLCNSWAFVMERFCRRLLPAVKNRYQPYKHLDNYICWHAQMQAVCHIHGLPTLLRSTTKWTYQGCERLSSRETMYQDYLVPHVIVGTPVTGCPPVDVTLTNHLVTYFGTTYMWHPWIRDRQELIQHINFFTLVQYGRFRLTDDGDQVCTARAVECSEQHRNNSYIRYDLNPDANAAFCRREDRPVRRTYYGRILDVYYIEFIKDIENNTRKPYILARVIECPTGGRDAALPQNPQVKYKRMGPPSMIHINTINNVIGRIQLNRC
ncbi:hypothetical protein FRC12_010183 [Ceratobasidium sp. 428]|nr:hypothetical protein FRC12_010183 [Ceratobasidium sp. 428]